jgi:hypothetical protein
VIYTYPPAENTFYPRCMFHVATGLECPGCGSTRAVHHLLHGRIAEAFLLNPFFFAVMILMLVMLPSLVRGETPRFVTRPWFGWTSFLVVVGWWIGRNLWWSGGL